VKYNASRSSGRAYLINSTLTLEMESNTWKIVPTDWAQDKSNSDLLFVKCPHQCKCILRKLKNYKSPKRYKPTFSPRQKAGVLMTSSTGDHTKLLVVQSRGRLWGVPKGGIEDGEQDIECAFRELGEETGIFIDHTKVVVDGTISMIHGKYFVLHDQPEHRTELTDCNDSTGVGWITKRCLKSMLTRRQVRFTSDFSRIIDIPFPLINGKETKV
jgi:ADP-ribose pyrophosphatase YjhB (NUDIX family)